MLVIVLLLGIGFRVYKMHCTGIIADEARTYRNFCQDLQTAVTNFKSTNNHILNSVFIVLTRAVLGKYEHFIRIPTLLFGALFCIAVTYIIHKTICSSVLKIVLLLFILLNWFLVDLTYLARGYSIALGATFTGIAVLINLSSRAAEHVKVNWLVVIFLIVMNFLAFGSMLSSFSIVVCINIAYLILAIFISMRLGRKALIHAIIRVIVIVLGSVLSLYLLYHQVYSKIMEISEAWQVEPFLDYMKKVLWHPLVYIDISWIKYNKLFYNASLALLVVCVVICLSAFFLRLKTRKKRFPSLTSPALVILLLSGAVLLLMFIQSVVFGRSLGMPRNGVFLLTLALISSGILMDRAANALARIKLLSFLLSSASVVSLAIMCFFNLPSPRAVDVRPYDWGKQSLVGPLVRMLRQIDPDKIWEVKLGPHFGPLHSPMQYYREFGYNAKQIGAKEWDVFICPEHSPNSRFVYFGNEYFGDHHCRIVVNTSSFRNKHVFYQMHY